MLRRKNTNPEKIIMGRIIMRKGYKITEHPNETIAENILLQGFLQ